MFGCEIMNGMDFSAIGRIFSFLKSAVDESIPLT
jgi:hypothetical protein